MSVLVLWSIRWISSLVHFKNGSKYHTKEKALVFIPLIRFLLCSLVSFSWGNFSFISACLMMFTSNIPKYLYVSFSPSVLNFLYLVVLFLPSFFVFHFSLLAWHIFLCQISSLYLDCISSLFVSVFPILFFIFGIYFHAVHVHLVVDFFCPVFHGIFNKLYDFAGYLVHFNTAYFVGPYHIHFFVNPHHS